MPDLTIVLHPDTFAELVAIVRKHSPIALGRVCPEIEMNALLFDLFNHLEEKTGVKMEIDSGT